MRMYLQEIRCSKGISLKQLSDMSKVAKSHIQKIESGTAYPTIIVLCKLAKALNVEASELFDDDE